MQGKKVIETISFQTGFRSVEIKDTPAHEDEFGLAGRYYYINGKALKLKGVNRHDTNPLMGKVISREQMEREIMPDEACQYSTISVPLTTPMTLISTTFVTNMVFI